MACFARCTMPSTFLKEWFRNQQKGFTKEQKWITIASVKNNALKNFCQIAKKMLRTCNMVAFLCHEGNAIQHPSRMPDYGQNQNIRCVLQRWPHQGHNFRRQNSWRQPFRPPPNGVVPLGAGAKNKGQTPPCAAMQNAMGRGGVGVNQILDNDGNTIARGMEVLSGGEKWTVGSICRLFVRLDRRSDNGASESRVVGKKRLYCVHVLGWKNNLVF